MEEFKSVTTRDKICQQKIQWLSEHGSGSGSGSRNTHINNGQLSLQSVKKILGTSAGNPGGNIVLICKS